MNTQTKPDRAFGAPHDDQKRREDAGRECGRGLAELLRSKKLDTAVSLPNPAFTRRGNFVRFEIAFGDPAITQSEPKLRLETLRDILSGNVVSDIPVVVSTKDAVITPLVTSNAQPFPLLITGVVPSGNIYSRGDDWLSFTRSNPSSPPERFITLSALDIRTLSLHRPSIAPESQYYDAVSNQWEHASCKLENILEEIQGGI